VWAKEIEEKLESLMKYSNECARLEKEIYEWWEDELKIGKVPSDGHLEYINSIPLDGEMDVKLHPEMHDINKYYADHLDTLIGSVDIGSGRAWGLEYTKVFCRTSHYDICKDLYRNVMKYIADESF
jgi:hypothetical protein